MLVFRTVEDESEQAVALFGIPEALAAIPEDKTTVCLRNWAPLEFLFDGAMVPLEAKTPSKHIFIVDPFNDNPACDVAWISWGPRGSPGPKE
jgi:hypothetical protein